MKGRNYFAPFCLKQLVSYLCLNINMKTNTMNNRNTKNALIIIMFLMTAAFSELFAQNTYTVEEGLANAKTSNKIGVIAIVSGQDVWSKKMNDVFSDAANMNSLNSNFIFMKMDVDQKSMQNYNGKTYTAADLAKLLGGTGYPTMVFFSPDGKVIRFKYNGEDVGFFPGYIEAPEFGKVLNYFSSGKYKNTDLDKVF